MMISSLLCCIENIFKTLDLIDESYYTRLDIQKQSVEIDEK